jgi:hypothetical protein
VKNYVAHDDSDRIQLHDGHDADADDNQQNLLEDSDAKIPRLYDYKTFHI